MKSSWLYFALMFLTVEKIVQHIVVTLALYFNWRDIASTVVVPPIVLMILGAVVALLFIVSLWGLLRKQVWSVNLLIGLALFDLVGEFVAQGRFAITMTVSFLAATMLLILCLVYRRDIRK